MTTAALQAISEEAHVNESNIVRTDREEGGGRVTYLEAPYIDYSKIKARIDSRGKDSCMPEFSVTITTDKVLYSRHKEWEERIHELVFLKLRDRKYVLSDPIAENAPETPRPNPDSAPKVDTPKVEKKDK